MKESISIPLAICPIKKRPHSWCQKLVTGILSQFKRSRLEMILPDQTVLDFGDQSRATPDARICIHDHAFFKKVLLYGDVGFGESFVDGDWSSDDVPALLSFFLMNVEDTPGLAGSRRKAFMFNLFKFANRCGHMLNRNTRANSKRNIEMHYDLSNAFYSIWLDSTWTYSSAWFTSPEQDLTIAQENKYRQLCDKLRLQPGQEVLEIGCGWGGFALFAARNYGVKVTGLTISREQLLKARERVTEAGLDDRINIVYCDYRDMTGQFDAIVSIEMLEAVGHQFLKGYFEQCHNLLKPHGVLGLQVIITPDSRYEFGRKSVDWIQKHIFPGGQLPSIAAITDAINDTGDLYLQHLDSFGLHYAETLRRWRIQFNSRVCDVMSLGFDDRFIRKWNYYLAYCEAAFTMRNINVSQMIFTRPNNIAFLLPSESNAHHRPQ